VRKSLLGSRLQPKLAALHGLVLAVGMMSGSMLTLEVSLSRHRHECRRGTQECVRHMHTLAISERGHGSENTERLGGNSLQELRNSHCGGGEVVG
jgi:hypothetical protein